MAIHPGYSGQPFRDDTYDRVGGCAPLCRQRVHIQVDGGVALDNIRAICTTPARRCSSRAPRSSSATTCRARTAASRNPSRDARARGRARARGGHRAYPKPTVGAVVVRDGEVVAEGVTEPGGRHAEVVALDAAGERARGATLYVTLEPCAHHGTTPPCTDAILAAGVERVVFGARDPNPEAAGGAERLRAQASTSSSSTLSRRAPSTRRGAPGSSSAGRS